MSGTKNKETELQQAEVRITRWPYLVAGILMLLMAGIVYAWSILKAPLAAEFGWNSAQLGLNYSITMGFFCLGGVFGGILTKKISAKTTLLIFSVVIFFGFFGSSRLAGSIALLYVFYGGMAGFGNGVVYNVVISSIVKWFPDKRTTASGALMVGFGSTSLILGPIMSNLIHTNGWRSAYFTLGVIVLVVLIAGAFFLRPPDARVDVFASGEKKKKITEVGEDHTAGQMLRSSLFWKSFIFLMLLSSLGGGVISLARDVSLSVGLTEMLAVSLVGVLSVCNGVSRVITGFLYDTIGRKRTMLISSMTAILASITMLLSVWLDAAPLLVVGMVLVGLAYGTCPPVTSGIAGSFFGTKNFGLNFSIYNLQLIPASFTATIAGVILGQTGSYVPFFILLIVFTLVAFVLNLSMKRS